MNITKKIKTNKYNIDYHLEDGAGAGVSINPIAFLVVQSNVVKLLPVDHSNVLDKILDYVPDFIDKANCMMNKCIQNKKDLGDKIINNMKKKCEEKIKKPDIEKIDKEDTEKEENPSITIEKINIKPEQE